MYRYSLIVTCAAAALALALATPSFIENDSIVFPEGTNSTTENSVSDKFKECVEASLDIFKIEYNGECRPLLSTEGACASDEWLVLDLEAATRRNPTIRGVCTRRLCPPNQHFWVRTNRCVFSNESAVLCPRGNTINTDYFGDGVCECEQNPVHAKDRDGACYPVFTRGPCRKEGVWVHVDGQAGCREDHCAATRASLPGKVVVPWKNRQCYPVKDRGPCEEGYVVSVNEHTYLPECVEPQAVLHLLDPPCTGADHAGTCTSSVNTPTNQFQTKVSQYAANKKPRTIKGVK